MKIRKNWMIPVLMISCIATLTSCMFSSTPSNPVLAAARQETVDALSSLPDKYGDSWNNVTNLPQDTARPDGWFDVSEYFSILNHLSMQLGYVLDYVYHGEGGNGQPYLYARRTESAPFNSLKELNNTYTDKSISHVNDYLEKVKTDDTEEAFFQFIVLRIMGGQFYLMWHANYNDHVIVCNPDAVYRLISSNHYLENRDLASLQKQVKKVDLEPKIEIQENIVVVRVVIFTQWGGLIEEKYTLARQFPHSLVDTKTKTLIHYDSELRY